jgi:hypothetical protein
LIKKYRSTSLIGWLIVVYTTKRFEIIGKINLFFAVKQPLKMGVLREKKRLKMGGAPSNLPAGEAFSTSPPDPLSKGEGSLPVGMRQGCAD